MLSLLSLLLMLLLLLFSFSFFFFWLVCFVLISFLVHYIYNVPLYKYIVLYSRPTLYKHSLLYVKLSVISSFHLKVGGCQLESFRYFDSL